MALRFPLPLRPDRESTGCAIKRPASHDALHPEPLIPFHLQPLEIAVVVVLVIFSLGAHEAAHAWVADWCGDDTARALGRVTLNPLPHIDLFGTILLPAFLLVASSGAFMLGQAKPVPVNMSRLRHRWRDMALVAVAGPAANLFIAFCSFLLLKILLTTGIYSTDQRVDELLLSCMFANVFLAVFNMLPIPPLDGSRVVTWLLPRQLRESYNAVGAFGILIVMVLLYLVPPVQQGIVWVAYATSSAIEWTASLGGLW
jgi:Zn-dependent protease